MQLSDLHFSYPTELIATRPSDDGRVLFKAKNAGPIELGKNQILEKIKPGDLLIVNDTRVERRRIFAGETEILFISSRGENKWEVLFPARSFSIGDVIELPEGLRARLIQKSLPQILELDQSVSPEYFARHGDPALPPYIQKARGVRRGLKEDHLWYQTDWAKHDGSIAAPTASLHFSKNDLFELQKKGVEIGYLTLHVGLGTFLPIKTDDLDEHHMHSESVRIPEETLQKIKCMRRRGGRLWAMGTTACRALESWAAGLLGPTDDGCAGETRLFIKPGYRFQQVDVLMTNFHQPESTLLALVGAFAGLPEVLRSYEWAIERKFRLFSYGNLTVWTRHEE